MPEKNKKIPKIRFKDKNWNDFPEWKEVELGEIWEFKTSSVDKKINPWEKKVFLVNYMDVYKHLNINNKNKDGLMIVSAKDSQIIWNNLKKWDILFTPSSETPDDIWHSVVIFEDLDNTLYSYHLVRFRPKIDLNILYSHYFCNIENVLKQISEFATWSTRFTVSIWDFKKIKISLPTIEEQEKIANFSNVIDESIELKERELEKLKEYKKWIMQQIFTKSNHTGGGQNSQILRFKDKNWNDFPEWKEYNFEDIFYSISPKNYQIQNNEIYKKWDFKVITQWKKFMDWFSNNKNKVFNLWEIILFWDHTTILKYINFEFIVWWDGCKILKNKKWNLKFLFYFLENNKIIPEWYKRHFSILKNLKISLPCLKEQQKIADFLSEIDEKINLKEKEILESKNYKKGLLQNMFV